MRLVGERPIVQREHEQHRHQAEGDGIELRDIEPRGDACRIGRRAVDHDHAERAEREHGAQQRPVDVVVETTFKQGSKVLF